ncbi:deoxyguanosinetriphosphate triphosphohydrolase family protein [Phycicoccus flavus]|uniref:deoxyguanosinetriphosphate triphosphohydrolase family protein n=1 Tax=Phycicoccus flavus TaxID=2502783 RepID=UPI000FEB76D3|nr:dNTP triphosphohydrolase [Phycicoccus flavus]NHA67722.1 dNTP triphosphohydrolase [Phycicoccus flavus]
MPSPPPGYSETDVEQFGLGSAVGTTDSDHRSPFQHDVDRVLYTPEFRALSGRTQVIAADQLGVYHNRLTHSLKVAQVGKRMASLLAARAVQDGEGGAGPDPDLVEAACLIHDIGHPPFGHIGEKQITKTLDELAGGRYENGFQANAQNLRIVTYMAVRRGRMARGLHLTRAALDASVKYPWRRGPKTAPGSEDDFASKHWGCYADLEDTLLWISGDAQLPDPPVEAKDAPARPVEEQIMDWADEVSYACHDVDDFYRAGLIPLADILNGMPRTALKAGGRNSAGYETNRFLAYLERTEDEGFDIDSVVRGLFSVQNTVGSIHPYESDASGRGEASAITSALISAFLSPDAIRLERQNDSEHLTRYGASLSVNPEYREAVVALKKLLWCYVVDRPGLATQQAGQRRILDDLVRWYAKEPGRLLAEDRREEYEEADPITGQPGHSDALRAAADTVASLTEAQAVRIHRRLSGVDYGQVTDLL